MHSQVLLTLPPAGSQVAAKALEVPQPLILSSSLQGTSAQAASRGGADASQALLPPCRDQWLEYAAIAFSTLDADTNGRISAADLMRMLGSKLPEHEVEYAVEDALLDAGYAGRVRAAWTLFA